MEVILSIILIGMLSVFMTVGITRIFEGYMFSKTNADMALKGEVAFARLVKELRSASSVSIGNGLNITYDYTKDGTTVSNRTLSWSGTIGDPLLLDGNILVESANDFELSYYSSHTGPGHTPYSPANDILIGVVLELPTVSGDVVRFSTRIMSPRI